MDSKCFVRADKALVCHGCDEGSRGPIWISKVVPNRWSRGGVRDNVNRHVPKQWALEVVRAVIESRAPEHAWPFDVGVHPQRGGQRVDDEAKSTCCSLRRKRPATGHEPACVVEKIFRASSGIPGNFDCNRNIGPEPRMKMVPIYGGVLRRAEKFGFTMGVPSAFHGLAEVVHVVCFP